MHTLTGKYGSALITGAVDETTTSQIIRMLDSPAFDGRVVIMPDAHAGAGSVIGTTYHITDKVCPSTVGVDIGCGVSVYKVDQRPIRSLKMINAEIRRDVPTGFNVRQTRFYTFETLNFLTEPKRAKYASCLDVDMDGYEELCERVGMKKNRALLSIGTLGGGELIATG